MWIFTVLPSTNGLVEYQICPGIRPVATEDTVAAYANDMLPILYKIIKTQRYFFITYLSVNAALTVSIIVFCICDVSYEPESETSREFTDITCTTPDEAHLS